MDKAVRPTTDPRSIYRPRGEGFDRLSAIRDRDGESIRRGYPFFALLL